MQDIKNQIEAVLFTTGKFIDVEELARLCNMGSVGLVKQAIDELKQDYFNKNSSLEILEENNKFKLNIKKQYLHLTTSLLNDAELDRPTQETLALIAYKNPAVQSEIIKMRSNTAYEHIKRLKENEFIQAEKKGRTFLLKLTPKFYDYFDVIEGALKEKLVLTQDKKEDSNETQ